MCLQASDLLSDLTLDTACTDKAGEVIAAEAKKLSAVGKLEITVCRISDLKPSSYSHTDDQSEKGWGGLTASASTDVHEKALKGQAKSHSVLCEPSPAFSSCDVLILLGKIRRSKSSRR